MVAPSGKILVCLLRCAPAPVCLRSWLSWLSYVNRASLAMTGSQRACWGCPLHMGLGVSTEKRSLYDNSFRSKIVSAPPCKNRKQNVSCSRSHRLILCVPPQAERGGCMQGNGLEKESCAQLPHLVLFPVSSSGPQTKENRWISEASDDATGASQCRNKHAGSDQY